MVKCRVKPSSRVDYFYSNMTFKAYLRDFFHFLKVLQGINCFTKVCLHCGDLSNQLFHLLYLATADLKFSVTGIFNINIMYNIYYSMNI